MTCDEEEDKHRLRAAAAVPMERCVCSRRSSGRTGASSGRTSRPQDPMSSSRRPMRHSSRSDAARTSCCSSRRAAWTLSTTGQRTGVSNGGPEGSGASSRGRLTCVGVERGPGQRGESRRQRHLHPAHQGLHHRDEQRRNAGEKSSVGTEQLQQPGRGHGTRDVSDVPPERPSAHLRSPSVETFDLCPPGGHLHDTRRHRQLQFVHPPRFLQHLQDHGVQVHLELLANTRNLLS